MTRWLLGLVLVMGCQPRPSVPAASTQAIQPDESEFAGPGIRISYPATWSAVPSDDFVLRIAETSSPGANAISLDVPRLPPHIPGLIPLGAVVNGYVDDLKKNHPGVQVNEPLPMTVARANARRVRSQWKSDGGTLVEEAILTVHGDRVYIFRAHTDVANEHGARVALNNVINSVKWE